MASTHPTTKAPATPAPASGAVGAEPETSAPTFADLSQAPDQFPDGPNVAPSAHELEAARGEVLPTPSGTADTRSDDTPRASPTPLAGD